MTKEELKKVLKPLIKECIKDVLFEPGVLSSVIKEVVEAMPAKQPPETTWAPPPKPVRENKLHMDLDGVRTKMLEAIGKDAYKGVDVFKGTKPLSSGGSVNAGAESRSQASNPLSGVDPSDPGVDISSLKIFRK